MRTPMPAAPTPRRTAADVDGNSVAQTIIHADAVRN
jgi:hypothetical protein